MLIAYWTLSALAWAGLTALAWRLGRNATLHGAQDRRNGWVAAAAVLGGAVLLRAATLLAFSEPYLSTDIWRYMHDGRVFSQGDNPYALSPRAWRKREAVEAEAQGRIILEDPVIDRINNPRLATIYQPLSQYVFALLSPADLRHPGVNRIFRLGFCVVDLGIVALLLAGLHRAGRSPWWAALYAWHPLAVTEVAWSGHQDALGILPLVGALLLASGPPRLMAMAAAGALFGAAVAVKPIVAPLALPMAACVARGRPRAAVVAAGACIVTLLGLYLPFALMDGGLSPMFDTARTFTELWSWNASVHAAATWALPDKTWADAACGVLLVGVLIFVTLRARDAVEAAMIFFFAAFLLSSTAHPWYLLWALALLPLVASGPGGLPGAGAGVWVMSLTVGWSYAAIGTPYFKPPAWVVWVEYVPVYAALAWGCSRLRLGGAVR